MEVKNEASPSRRRLRWREAANTQLLDVPDEEEQAGINGRHLKALNKTGLLRGNPAGSPRGPVYMEKH